MEFPTNLFAQIVEYNYHHVPSAMIEVMKNIFDGDMVALKVVEFVEINVMSEQWAHVSGYTDGVDKYGKVLAQYK